MSSSKHVSARASAAFPQRPESMRHSVLAAAVLCLIGLPAFGQVQAPQPAASAASASEEASPAVVVVTANRKAEAARDVPMAIDVINAKDIDRYQLLDAKDIVKMAPGVEMTNNDGRQNVASMRGVSFNPDSGVPVAAVGMYINDVAVSSNVAFNALFDLSEIEVLRGPQGTLRGQMAPAGAITMATRRPDLARVGGELILTADDRGGQNVKGAFNLPLVTDEFALRFAIVQDENRLNQIRDITNGQRSKGDTDGYRLSAAWQPIDDLRIDVMYQKLNVVNHLVKQMVGDGVVTPFNLGRPAQTLTLQDLDGVTDVTDHYITNAELTTLKANWSLDDHHSLSLVAGYQDTKLDQGFDRDIGNVLPGTSILQQTNTAVLTDSVELIFSSEGNPFWNYTVGLYDDHTKSQTNVDVASGSFLLDIPGGSDSKAIFTRQSFKLGETLTLDAGLRYSRLSADVQSVASVPGFTFPPSIPANYADTKDKPLTWGLSLTNRFSRDLTGYVSAAHSFRPGTYQVGILTPIDPSLLGMPPEKSNSFEAGFKSDLLNRKLYLNVTAFVQRYQGFIDRLDDTEYQYVDPASGQTVRDISPFNSSGNAHVQGIEAQILGRPSANWDANLGLSFVRSRYTSGKAPCNDSNGDGIPDSNGPSQIPAGQQVAFCPLRGSIAELPAFSLSTSTEYRFAGDGMQPYVGGLVNFRPGFHSDKADYDYRSFTNVLLNAGVRSANGRWELGAFVKNALDQRRITKTGTSDAQTSAGTLGLFDSGYKETVGTTPRQIGVSGRYTF